MKNFKNSLKVDFLFAVPVYSRFFRFVLCRQRLWRMFSPEFFMNTIKIPLGFFPVDFVKGRINLGGVSIIFLQFFKCSRRLWVCLETCIILFGVFCAKFDESFIRKSVR